VDEQPIKKIGRKMQKRILLSIAAFLILGFGVRAKATLTNNPRSLALLRKRKTK